MLRNKPQPKRRWLDLAPGDPVIVVAGPGSVKSRTLTQRVAHLIGQRGVAPGQILALTFTRRAAAEGCRSLAQGSGGPGKVGRHGG